jgi:hypothetical protein
MSRASRGALKRGVHKRNGVRGKVIIPPTVGEINFPPTGDTPLSPVQWQVFKILQEMEARSEICSYGDIAARIQGKREGVKSAIQVLHKVGAFLAFSIVRNAKIQGIQLRLDHAKQFHETSLRQSKGLPKRGSDLPLTVGGQREDGTRMYLTLRRACECR